MSLRTEMDQERPVTSNAAIGLRGKCLRCHEWFGKGDNCRWCGVGRDRIVRKCRRRKIGGKRGRNSGEVRTNK